MNEKRLPPRLMVLLVVLKGEKVYKVPIRSEIELDHLKDFNTLRRILTPLVQLYHGVGFDTRLTYDEFSIFINDLQHLGYERLDEYSSGIQELVEAKPITENNQDVEKIRKGLLISLKSQELSEVLATKIKQAIHEVFENEKKKCLYLHINFKIDKNMKTNSVTYNQADELTKVVRNFLEKKSTFELDSDEQGSLLNFLMGLLIKLEDDYKLNCLDINQVQIYDTTYYSFIFESIITADTNPYKGQLASAAVQFMNEFTDNDGRFISFNQLDRNNWIFQLNFSIA